MLVRTSHDTENYYKPLSSKRFEFGLSLGAIGLLDYLLDQADKWEPNINQLVSKFQHGKHTIQKLLQELKAKGFLIRVAVRNTRGQIVDWVTKICEVPNPGEVPTGPNYTIDVNNNYHKHKSLKFQGVHPDSDPPDLDEPDLVDRSQTNKDITTTKKTKTHSPPTPLGESGAGKASDFLDSEKTEDRNPPISVKTRKDSQLEQKSSGSGKFSERRAAGDNLKSWIELGLGTEEEFYDFRDRLISEAKANKTIKYFNWFWKKELGDTLANRGGDCYTCWRQGLPLFECEDYEFAPGTPYPFLVAMVAETEFHKVGLGGDKTQAIANAYQILADRQKAQALWNSMGHTLIRLKSEFEKMRSLGVSDAGLPIPVWMAESHWSSQLSAADIAKAAQAILGGNLPGLAVSDIVQNHPPVQVPDESCQNPKSKISNPKSKIRKLKSEISKNDIQSLMDALADSEAWQKFDVQQQAKRLCRETGLNADYVQVSPRPGLRSETMVREIKFPNWQQMSDRELMDFLQNLCFKGGFPKAFAEWLCDRHPEWCIEIRDGITILNW